MNLPLSRISAYLAFALFACGIAFADDALLRIPETPSQVPSEMTIDLKDPGHSNLLANFTLKLPTCLDCGMHWELLGQNLPNVAIDYQPLYSLMIEKGLIHLNGAPLKKAGGMMLELISFPGLNPGNYEFELVYGRHLLGSQAQHLTVHVHVTQ